MDDMPVMTERPPRTPGGPVRPSSAGVPGPEVMPPDERIADLEDRLARLEGSVSLTDRGRDLMSRVMPPEASRHFRNAGREQLLGFRSIIDFWIRRIESAEDRASRDEASHQSIEIE